MMKKTILLFSFVVLLSGAAFADVLTVPGFGHGFINTPVAWNSQPLHWKLGVLGAFGGGKLAKSGTYSALYAYDRMEFGVGAVSFGDVNNTNMMGGEARYNFVRTTNDFFATALGGIQRSDSDKGGNSTAVFGLLFGQRFHNGGVSFTTAYWTEVGQDSLGNKVGNDLEWAGNLYFDLDSKNRWKIFGEAYGFTDADKSGQAAGFLYSLQTNLKLSAAVLNVTDPFDENQFQLGVTMTFPKEFNFDP